MNRMSLLAAVLLLLSALLHAETGYDAWLRYNSIDDKAIKERYSQLPAVIVALDDSPVVKSAQEELLPAPY